MGYSWLLSTMHVGCVEQLGFMDCELCGALCREGFGIGMGFVMSLSLPWPQIREDRCNGIEHRKPLLLHECPTCYVIPLIMI